MRGGELLKGMNLKATTQAKPGSKVGKKDPTLPRSPLKSLGLTPSESKRMQAALAESTRKANEARAEKTREQPRAAEGAFLAKKPGGSSNEDRPAEPKRDNRTVTKIANLAGVSRPTWRARAGARFLFHITRLRAGVAKRGSALYTEVES